MIRQNLLYFYVGVIGLYSIMVAYYGSKICLRFGRTRKFWFLLHLLLNPYSLIFVLLAPKYRSQLHNNEKRAIALYLAIFIGLLLVPIIAEIAVKRG